MKPGRGDAGWVRACHRWGGSGREATFVFLDGLCWGRSRREKRVSRKRKGRRTLPPLEKGQLPFGSPCPSLSSEERWPMLEPSAAATVLWAGDSAISAADRKGERGDPSRRPALVSARDSSSSSSPGPKRTARPTPLPGVWRHVRDSHKTPCRLGRRHRRATGVRTLRCVGRNEGPGARWTHAVRRARPPQPFLRAGGTGIPILATQRPLAASEEAPARGGWDPRAGGTFRNLPDNEGRQ